MTSKHASIVKISGHVNEGHFAKLINGQVNPGTHTDKRDVIDSFGRSHSVKAGTWWQIFLYGKQRLENDNLLKGIGNLAEILVNCIDAYPLDYYAYKTNKVEARLNLQPHMRELNAELSKENIMKAFLEKALFDGGNAEFLSIYRGPAKDNIDK